MNGLLISSLGLASSMIGASKRHRMSREDAQGNFQDWLRELHRSVLAAFDEQLKAALIRQGAAPEALAGPELTVSLEDISIVDWIQAIQLFAKHAVITVIHDDMESRLWCAKGALIDAESGQLSGEAAVYRIVSLEKGHIVTELRAVHRERTIRASTQWLLLEAARRKDEAALLRSRLGELARRYRAAGVAARQRSLNTAEAATLRLFDEPHRLSDIVLQSELGEVETLAALDGLLRAGLLIPVASVEEPESPAPRSEAPSRRSDSVPPSTLTWSQERPAQRSKQRWVASTALMALPVALAAWWGARAAASMDRPDPRAPVAASAPPREHDTYPVLLRAYPPEAELEIDGRVAGKGQWTSRFPRDGMLHELRVTAAGHIPARILFIDTPPPLDVHLEPLPAALLAAVPPAPVAEAEAEPEALRERPRRRHSAADRGARLVAAPAEPPPVVESRKAPAREKRKPYVRVIDVEAERAAGLNR